MNVENKDTTQHATVRTTSTSI